MTSLSSTLISQIHDNRGRPLAEAGPDPAALARVLHPSVRPVKVAAFQASI